MKALTFTPAYSVAAMMEAGHKTATAFKRYLPWILLAVLACLFFMNLAHAVGTLDASANGQAIKLAYDKLNDLTGGYGKALILTIGFIVTAFAVLAAQATGPVLKFIGIAIFLSMALPSAFLLAGAQI